MIYCHHFNIQTNETSKDMTDFLNNSINYTFLFTTQFNYNNKNSEDRKTH